MSELAAPSVAAIIREKSDEFENFFRNGDAAGLVENYYVREPVMALPEAPLVEGRENIVPVFEAFISEYSDCKLKQLKVESDGDLAYEISECHLECRDQSQIPPVYRYLIVWRNTPDLGWRVESDFVALGALT